VKNESERNLQECLKAFYQKQIRSVFYPVYYGIEISRHCNFACVMCPNTKYEANQKGNMSFELFQKIIDEISPFAKIIKLHWIGEPLINKKIVQMIRYARKKTTAKLFMSTNGSLLKGKLLEDIRTSGLDKIIFSLDGNSKDIFEKIRLNSNFDEVLENVNNFVDAVEKKGGPHCEVKIIQFSSNQSEIDRFKRRWDRYKKTIVHVMWLSTWGGQLPELNNLSQHLSPYNSSKRSVCADLWFKMQIDWSGEVALCCWDWAGTASLGNVLNTSVQEIWNGDEIIKKRESQVRQEYQGICSNCNEWAKVQEYEFWYSFEKLKEDASVIWDNDTQDDGQFSKLLKDL
jgi:spiro-SPASM protein